MSATIDTLALHYTCPRCDAEPGMWCQRALRVEWGYVATRHLHAARVRPLIQARGDGVREGLARRGVVAVPLVGVAT